MAASLGKVPTTSVPRLVLTLRRSSGLLDYSLVLWTGGKAM